MTVIRQYIFYLLLLAILALSQPVFGLDTQDYEQIKIISSSVVVSFPTSIKFDISAQSSVEITKIRLNYTIDRDNYAEVTGEVWPLFTPSQSVNASWSWDMRKLGLPPSTEIIYWWTVENNNNEKFVTQKSSITFADKRYNWNTISDKNITIHWYNGNELFARELLKAAQEAIERLFSNAFILKNNIEIFIYGNSTDFRNALIAPRGWEGGIAYPEHHKIAIGIAPSQIEWGKSALAHELGHLLVHQLTFSPYGTRLPVWLDEGLATLAESSDDNYYENLVLKAYEKNKIISMRTLISPFSADPDKAVLSYAQSWSFVKFLRDNYDYKKILELLDLFKNGSTCDNALLSVYGKDLKALQLDWLESLSTASKDNNK